MPRPRGCGGRPLKPGGPGGEGGGGPCLGIGEKGPRKCIGGGREGGGGRGGGPIPMGPPLPR